MENINTGQVNTHAAEIYEEFFLPALFQGWTERVADAAHIREGQRVLDVACGTGVLARTVMQRVGAAGSVVGLDINPGMLVVARRKAPNIEWRQGKAESLPFGDASFDAVVSQFGLMFFKDRPAAIREMVRVLNPGGHLAVAVWASLDATPGYAAMVALLKRLFGDRVADALRAPFILGNKEHLAPIFADVGLTDVEVRTYRGEARFPSVSAWVHTDIKGWTLADMINNAQLATLLEHAQKELAAFIVADGSVRFETPAHIITGVKC